MSRILVLFGRRVVIFGVHPLTKGPEDCVRKLSTAYLVPVNALEKRVRTNLLTATDFASHQSTDQITGGNREGTENGKKEQNKLLVK